MGLPPKLFPDNFLRNSCSFFLSPKLLSSKLSNSYKILKIEELVLEDVLPAKKPLRVRNLISWLMSLFIVIKHSFLFLNARSSWVIINSSPLDKQFIALLSWGLISSSKLINSENTKLQPSSCKCCICSSKYSNSLWVALA